MNVFLCPAPYYGRRGLSAYPTFPPANHRALASTYDEAKRQCNAVKARLKTINDPWFDARGFAEHISPSLTTNDSYHIQQDNRPSSLANVPKTIACERKW